MLADQLKLLRGPDLRRVWAARAISDIGDRMQLVAVTFFVFTKTGSISTFALMLLVEAIPALLFGMIAGVYVDRLNTRSLMTYLDILSFVVVMPLFFTQKIWVVFIVVFVQSVFSRFYNPAVKSLVASVATTETLISVNAILASSRRFMQILGPTVGGFIIGVIGIKFAFGINALTFLISALILLRIRKKDNTLNVVNKKGVFEGVIGSLSDGLKYSFGQSQVFVLFLITMLVGAAIGINNSFFVPLVTGSFHMSAQDLGYLQSGLGFGSLFGTILMGVVGTKVHSRIWVLLSLALLSMCYWSLPQTHVLVILLAIRTVMGFALMFYYISITTVLQTISSRSFYGRVMSVQSSIEDVSTLAVLAVVVLFNPGESVISLFKLTTIPALIGTVISAVYLLRSRRNLNADNLSSAP